MVYKKITIISDINGNIVALNDFLAYVNRHTEIEHIINLGNFIGLGGFSAEVFDMITSDSRFININGPSETSLINDLEDEYLAQIRKEFGDKRLSKLKEIPTFKTLTLFDKRFFLIHTSKYLDSLSFSERLKFLFMNEYSDTNFKDQHFYYDYILYGCSGVSEISTYIDQPYKEKVEVFISPGDLAIYTQNIITFCIIEFRKDYEDITIKRQKTNSDLIVKKILCKSKNNIPASSYYGYYNIDGDKGDLIVQSRYSESRFYEYYRDFWEKSIASVIEKSSYIGFSVPKKDTDTQKEIKDTFISFSEDEFSDDYYFAIEGEVNEKTKEILLSSYFDNKKEFKWDEVWLLDKNKELIFSYLKHDGKYQFRNLDEEEMAYMKNIIQQSKNLNYEVYE